MEPRTISNHDVFKQISYIQQCLSSDKKPIGFFLGAGCSMSIRIGPDRKPLIPDIVGLTKIVLELPKKEEKYASLFEALNRIFVVDERNNPTVEDFLCQIRSLRAIAGMDKVRGLSAQDLDKLDEIICDVIHENVNAKLPSNATPFHSLAAWINAIQRNEPIEIFTTNYDLLVEQALEEMSVPYFDGFAGSKNPFFDIRTIEEDILPTRWTRLWKIHGSINWYKASTGGAYRGSINEQSARRIIHPSHLKYDESRRMPYLVLMDRLKNFLKRPTSALILCGYSFRDEHINEVIIQGLQSSNTSIAFTLLFGNLNDYPHAKALAKKQPNLTLLARDGAIIGGIESQWPEKDNSFASSHSCEWIKWTRASSPSDTEINKFELLLGDFAHFGKFLNEIIGNKWQ